MRFTIYEYRRRSRHTNEANQPPPPALYHVNVFSLLPSLKFVKHIFPTYYFTFITSTLQENDDSHRIIVAWLKNRTRDITSLCIPIQQT